MDTEELKISCLSVLEERTIEHRSGHQGSCGKDLPGCNANAVGGA